MLISAGVIAVVGAPRRPFDLFRADLAHPWLVERDLKGANLGGAHLDGADLSYATGLRPAQIDRAFGDAATKRPDGLAGRRTGASRWTSN